MIKSPTSTTSPSGNKCVIFSWPRTRGEEICSAFTDLSSPSFRSSVMMTNSPCFTAMEATEALCFRCQELVDRDPQRPKALWLALTGRGKEGHERWPLRSQAKHPHCRLTACRLGYLWLECQVGHHSVAAAYDMFLDGNRMVFCSSMAD